jgi:C4-dicarboxylate transporter DctM subunit
MALLFVMGCFLDPTSCTFIVLPIAAPALKALGVDLIWFAVIFVINMEIAAITPPVGFNLYAVHQITKVSLGRVIKGTLPFLAALLLGLIIVLLVPQIATWLPSTMK